jgi:hypothetical protein
MTKRNAWFRTKRFEDWDELERELESYYLDRGSGSNHWVFRGVANVSYGLLTSLERELSANPWWREAPAKAERLMIDEYKKRAHQYLPELFREPQDVEWLSLMQHHGAPTRLLDWTRTPYVALFFALRGAVLSRENPAIWVLNLDYCEFAARKSFQKAFRLKALPHAADLFDLSQKKALPVVFPIYPLKAHVRLTIQQGILLYPGDVELSFDENLSRCVGMDDMLRLEIDRELIRVGLHRLHMMNISHATLFPGLDGFSASMKDLLWAHEFANRPET